MGNSTQLFPAWVDEWLGGVVLAVLLGFIVGLPALWTYAHSDYVERTGLAPEQPIQFSHRHHVAEVGLDCRYCHSTVETGASAGMPASSVCLTCHSQLYADNDIFAPLRLSYSTGQPLRWRRVYRLPDYVYFNHSIHLAKGVGCVECHGRVGQVALVQLNQPLTMDFCLDCHKQPGSRLRSQEHLFQMDSAAEAGLSKPTRLTWKG
ncbi:cytochrome c3 family protein [bacterium]|nr:cytochrome c3 family protein [bacterium]